MPHINQLPLATEVSATDLLPVSQGDITRAASVGLLLQGTQPAITIANGALLGRVSAGPGAPEALYLGAGLQVQDDVLLVDHSAYQQTTTLSIANQVILNDSTGTPSLMPISLLRGLYTAGQNITIDADGTIQSTPTAATGSSIGAVAVGNGLIINASGQLSVNTGTVTGTIAAGDDPRIVGAEETANKGQPRGYASLDANALIPLAQIPANIPISQANLDGANTSNTLVTTAVAGAQGRTLASRFADVVNVNDFGLARNGSTDDSVAFAAACTAAMAGKKKLYIPAGGAILLTDNFSMNLSNIAIFGDNVRDYGGTYTYGRTGSQIWLTGTTNTPFKIGPCVQFQGVNFFWPHQTEAATTANGNQPTAYPPLFTFQSPAINIVYFNFVDCQVTNAYDFFTAIGTSAVTGACNFDRSIIYAVRNCFTLQIASTTVGGIMSSNTYVFGYNIGIWLSGGTLDISTFVDTGFDNVPTVLQGDPGCAMFSTRFTGGAWYPIYFNQTGNPDTTAIKITSPAPGGVGLNVTFSSITVPFINGSLCSISGSNVSSLSFSDIRCNNFGHTVGGTGPYYGFQFNTPNANIRVDACDFGSSNAGLSNTGIQISGCQTATIADCVFRYCSAPIDVETTSGIVTLSHNTSFATQGAGAVITGIGTGNVHDLFNSWDKPIYAYNGFAPNNYRAGATIGLQPVASTASSGYVGMQPSALGSGGGTRFGITAAGTSPVSLLTNSFGEEQFRANRQVGAVNYVAVRGSLSGSPTQITTNGADSAGSIQLTALGAGATYLGSSGTSGSPISYQGARADQSYVGIAPANGFSITLPVNCSTMLLKPAGALATGTITLPAAALDGQMVQIWSTQSITALTVVGHSGTIVANGAHFALPANTSVAFFWNAANVTWFQSLGSGASAGSIASQNADSVGITGGSITGLSILGVGNDAATSASILLDTAPGFGRQIVYQTDSLSRWVVGAEGNAENFTTGTTTAHPGSPFTIIPLASNAGISVGMLVSGPGVAAGTNVVAVNTDQSVTLSQPIVPPMLIGSVLNFYTNQGSDFAILPYDDTGAPLAGTLGQPFTIARATGQVTIKSLAAIGSAAAPTPATGDASTSVATTAFVANTIAARAGAASGLATLDGSGHVPISQLPASVQGGLSYQGAWNAATNTPALASGTGTKGFYYTVATAGSTVLDGIAQWNAGDHAAFNGSAWEKLDGVASEVVSVAGRTGAVALALADIAGLGSMAAQSAASIAITGGSMDATAIGAATPAAAAFSTLTLPGLTGYLYANGSSASTTSSTIPAANITGLGSIASQSAGAAAITGGTIDATAIGATTPAAGAFSTLKLPSLTGYLYANGSGIATTSTTIPAANITGLGSISSQSAGAAAITGGTIDATAVGATTPAAGAFSTLKLPSLTGYLYANGSGIATTSTTIPVANITGLGSMSLQSSGAVAITAGTVQGLTALSLGSNAGGAFSQFINGAAGVGRQIVWQTAGISRWALIATGDTESAPVTQTTSGATTASATLLFTSTTGIVVGQSVSGTGITAGSLVVSLVANTSVTISNSVTVASGVVVTFYPNVGTLMSLRAYDDGGNLVYTPLSFGRAAGAAITLATLSYGPVVVQGGSSVLGNTRGAGAFDGQQTRTTATQIASGANAVLFGSGSTASGAQSVAMGTNNTASATSAVAFGGNATASGSYSQARGYYANDRGRYGSHAFASGQSAASGDTQTAFGVLRAASTTSAAARMTADGNTASAINIWNIPNNTAFLVRMDIMGWSSSGTLAASYVARFRIKRGASAATTSLSNTTLSADADNDAITGLTAPTLAADTSNGGLNLSSGFATSSAMRWAARVISAVELQ